MEERWAWIPGYENRYQVSDQGRVRSWSRRKPFIMKTKTDKDGYKYLGLTKHYHQRFFRVNRLVLLAFVGAPPHEDCQGNHINGIKDDNALTNLEWTTNAGNQTHSYEVLGNRAAYGEEHGHTVITEEQALSILERIANGETQDSLALEFNMSQSSISAMTRRETWKYLVLSPEVEESLRSRNVLRRDLLKKENIENLQCAVNLMKSGESQNAVVRKTGLGMGTVNALAHGRHWSQKKGLVKYGAN